MAQTTITNDKDSVTLTVEGVDPETVYQVSIRLEDLTRKEAGERFWLSNKGLNGYQSNEDGVFVLTVPLATIARDFTGPWDWQSDHMTVAMWLRDGDDYAFNHVLVLNGEQAKASTEINA